LSGDFAEKTIYKHQLRIPNSTQYVPLGKDWIPTGELLDMQGSLVDFREWSQFDNFNRFGGALDDNGQPGVDHIFKIDANWGGSIAGTKMTLAAQLKGGTTQMDIWTTQPVAHVYSANHIPKSGDDGRHT